MGLSFLSSRIPVVVIGLSLGMGLGLGLGAGPAQGQEPATLRSAQVGVVLSPEGRGGRVRLVFELEEMPLGGALSFLAIASPHEVEGLEVLAPGGWVPLGRIGAGEGRIEAVWIPEAEEADGRATVALRYSTPLAQLRRDDGVVVGMRIPVLAPLGLRGEAGSGTVSIEVRSGAPLEVRSPFPSTLKSTELVGGWGLVGSAPAVPGILRFGDHDPGLAGLPREAPGGVFWGLWVALGGLLLTYVVWVVRMERGHPIVAPGGGAGG